MKKIFLALFFIFNVNSMVIVNMNNSNDSSGYPLFDPELIVDMNNIFEYQLFDDEDEMRIPLYLLSNGFAYSVNSSIGQRLFAQFLAKRYQLNVNQIDGLDVIELDNILSILDRIGENAKNAGDLELYNDIESFIHNLQPNMEDN